MQRAIHGVEVHGVDVDPETRCAHYHGPSDVIALRFKCCGNWFPCHICHSETADHTVKVWPADEFDAHAILCGACGYQLTIREYLDSTSVCPHCARQFNPGCRRHRHLYFSTA